MIAPTRSMRTAGGAFVCVVLLSLLEPARSSAAQGRTEPDGEFQVAHAGSGPSVAIDARGEFAVAYKVRGAWARVFSASGEPRGPAFLLSENADQFTPAVQVAGNDQGDFVAVFGINLNEGKSGAPNRMRAHARRFDRSGRTLGPPLPVSSLPIEGIEQYPSVAMDARGRFVVAWMVDQNEVWARRFDRDGTPRGSELKVHGESDAGFPSVAMTGDGRFLVYWTTRQGSQVMAGARARAFDRDGQPLSDEVDLNTASGQYGRGGAFASRAGYTVTSPGREASGSGLFARRLDLDGGPAGDPVQIVPFETLPREPLPGLVGGIPAISGTPDGRTIVVWQSRQSTGDDDSGWSIQARPWTRDLWPLALPLQVNQVTEGEQEMPAVACSPSGSCVVAWQWEYDPEARPEIRARRIRLSSD